MTEAASRDEICRIGRSLFERGYVHATAGNISIRLDDGFLITPTDACLGTLDPNQLARIDSNGVQISGDKASKTIFLHTRIYMAATTYQANTRCVIHTHSTHCVALTLNQPGHCVLPETVLGKELLCAITPYFVMKVGHVPLIPYHHPGAIEAADAVAAVIHRYGEANLPVRAVMLARLGPNVWHDSASAAMATLEELEETAELVLKNRTLVNALTEPQLDELRQIFDAKW